MCINDEQWQYERVKLSKIHYSYANIRPTLANSCINRILKPTSEARFFS